MSQFLTGVLPGKSFGWQQSQDSQHHSIINEQFPVSQIFFLGPDSSPGLALVELGDKISTAFDRKEHPYYWSIFRSLESLRYGQPRHSFQ